MIQGYESVASQPAWKNMRNMQIHPTKAVLPDGKVMTGNVFRRNIVAYCDPKAKLLRMGSVPLDHNEYDDNLVWHYGQPLLTGQFAVKETSGPNLAPNAGFEDGEAGKQPNGWKWQVKPNDSKAVVDADVKFSGKHSLRIEGRGTTTDSAHAVLFPNFVSADIPAKTGQVYRLTARLRAAEPGTKFSMMPQCYEDKVFFWSKGLDCTLGTEWKEYELVFKIPAPGESGYHEKLKAMRIRFDTRQEKATVWVDAVTLHEAVGMDEWESWQALGVDKHSIVADPLFVNAKKDDYRLNKNSPAFKLGFKPIPVEKIGPYSDPLRASWPIKEAEGAREHPLVSE